MEIDQVVDGFKLRALIAKGQSSQVWEVVEQSSGRHFALKALLEALASNREHRRLLKHEAKVGKELAHDHIIKIVKSKEDGKMPYFVMDYFPAGSMKVRVVNKQVDFIREFGQLVFKQIATALAYMHGNKWLHRDIKPDNMLANSAGEAKLIDFAIAQKIRKRGFFEKLFGGKASIQGTRSYMSPEQIRGEDLDPRADLYSFGASLYEIVAFRPPFVGLNSQDLLNKQLHDKPLPPQSYNPDVTDDFSKLVMQMLAKKKEDRPSNFHEILIRLKALRVFKSQSMQQSHRL